VGCNCNFAARELGREDVTMSGKWRFEFDADFEVVDAIEVNGNMTTCAM
jgi:hypothetical protein